MPTGPAVSLAGGITLFLAGDALFRRALRIGTPWYRAAGAALALACWPVAATLSAAAGIVLLTVVVAATLAAERWAVEVTVKA